MSVLRRVLSPFASSDSYRVLVHLSLAVPLGAAALAVLIAGWVTTAVLVIVTRLAVVSLLAFCAWGSEIRFVLREQRQLVDR